MIATDLRGVADAVLRRAEREGSVSPDDVRQELTQAGVSDDLVRDVLALCRRALRKRDGRYHYVTSRRPARPEDRQRQVRSAVRAVIRRHKQVQRVERRGQDRIDFIQPVRLVTEDGRQMRLLSRDLSTTGLRLIGARSLLGQKVRVFLGDEPEACSVIVRVLWTCAVGDDLFENGGMFLDAGQGE